MAQVCVVGLSAAVLEELSSEDEEWLQSMSVLGAAGGRNAEDTSADEASSFEDSMFVDPSEDAQVSLSEAQQWEAELARTLGGKRRRGAGTMIIHDGPNTNNLRINGSNSNNNNNNNNNNNDKAKTEQRSIEPLVVKQDAESVGDGARNSGAAAMTASGTPIPSAGAMILKRKEQGKGHRKTGSLAPVLEHMAADSPGMSRRSQDREKRNSVSMASPPSNLNASRGELPPDVTPNTRKLLMSSPSMWLRTAINPNVADPRYVPSGKKNKTKREFAQVHLLQEIQGHISAVWTAEISPDGQYYLSAGRDLKIQMYRIASPEDDTNNVLHHECTFEGHTGDVLCVSWAPSSDMFVSSSMDKTVRLWKLPTKGRQSVNFGVQNGSGVKSVRTSVLFEHSDFVPAVAFHPNGDWIISGCFDKKLRVWSSREKTVLYWVDLASFITSIALASDGRMCICGDVEGKATFFDTEGLRWVTQINVRSRRGRNSKGKKISGIRVMPDQEHILITSNDSRIRLFRLSDFGLVCKYKGIQNEFFQIVARPSDSGEHIICGTETNNVLIWNTHKRSEGLSFSLARQKFTERKDRNTSFEFWRCSDAAVTVAMFFPHAARQRITMVNPFNDPLADPDPDTSFIVTADETGKIVVFENRKRIRKHMLQARAIMSRGSTRDAVSRVTPKVAPKDPANTGSSLLHRTSDRPLEQQQQQMPSHQHPQIHQQAPTIVVQPVGQMEPVAAGAPALQRNSHAPAPRRGTFSDNPDARRALLGDNNRPLDAKTRLRGSGRAELGGGKDNSSDDDSL